MRFEEIIEYVGSGIDTVGVLAIVVGAAVASVRFILKRQGTPERSFSTMRQGIARAILLGLEFLIAGDIIRTIVVAPTLGRLYVLGLIVLIRTFLSFTLEVEIEGRWPWQASREARLE